MLGSMKGRIFGKGAMGTQTSKSPQDTTLRHLQIKSQKLNRKATKLITVDEMFQNNRIQSTNIMIENLKVKFLQ